MSARHLRNMRVKLDPLDHGYGDGSHLDREERRRRKEAYMLGWTHGTSGETRVGAELDGEDDQQVLAAYHAGRRIGGVARTKAVSDACKLFGYDPRDGQ